MVMYSNIVESYTLVMAIRKCFFNSLRLLNALQFHSFFDPIE